MRVKNKKGIEPWIAVLILGVMGLIILVGAIIVLRNKGFSAIDFFKSLIGFD
jgi:hypothetical protein